MGRTKVIFILDMSGSMDSRAEDVRGGVNSYVQQLKEDKETEYHLGVTIFDNLFERVYWDQPLSAVPPLTAANYQPRGSTALWDAVGKTIREAQALSDEKVLVVIYTDGMENASHEWTADRVKVLLDEKKALGWDFVFLGVAMDTWATGHAASQIGLGQTQSSVGGSGQGVSATFKHLAGQTRSYSKTGQTVSSTLKDLPEEAKKG